MAGRRKKRTKWVWSHPKDGGLGGFVKAVVAFKKGKVVVALKGQTGTYLATARWSAAEA